MFAFKKTLRFVSVLCLFASVQAHAEDPMCRGALSAIQQLGAQDNESMMKVTAEWQVKLADGFIDNGHSGILFRENTIVGNGTGDMHIMRPLPNDEQKALGQVNPIRLFIPFDSVDYPGEKGTVGGAYKVALSDTDQVKTPGVICSNKALSYGHHWFPGFEDDTKGPQVGDVYCVRTRNGQNYALVKLTNICEKGLVFDYKFNGPNPYFPAK
jgi:hypothetical protein